MKAFLVLAFMIGLYQAQANELDQTLTCLDSITQIQHTQITEKTVFTPKKRLMWLEDNSLIMQNNERATVFDLNLKQGLNVISLANNKGKELEVVCINKMGTSQYIDSFGDACMMQNKTQFFQTISYANDSFESNDPISNKIFEGLNKLRISFKKNVNRNKCEQYMNTFQNCYKNFSLMQGSNKIPRTENRYLFVLKELRRTLLSQCQLAS
tara:strand:+ start:176766 stop:177398 length:633 start_codon:yes stop_codon:yes gene_type:complete